ncbi:MAG TPA: patatin-like phospholipase family protein [Chthonomonadaceae bacterium]|nr:patatin-like phospholipase family protein [Chthonomonadaceae bacterium]
MKTVFGIFQGGGAKGLAHVGALTELENMGIEFAGVAGTSAGSIIAALIAAGYKASELYSPIYDPSGVLDQDFTTLLGDEKEWRQFKTFQADLAKFPPNPNICTAGWNFLQLWLRNSSVMSKLQTKLGVFDTTTFEDWLEKLLKRKVQPSDNYKVTFQDIEKKTKRKLRIIATDLSNKTVKLFGDLQTPTCYVSEAVAASVSIPYVFQPKKLYNTSFVDGGLLSNFPAWVFDEERIAMQRRGEKVFPTLGFKLIERLNPDDADMGSLTAFTRGLFNTIFAGTQFLETRQVIDLHVVFLKVDVTAIEFDMSRSQREKTFLLGKDATRETLKRSFGLADPIAMTKRLEFHARTLKDKMDKPDIHLRMNISLPTEGDRLAIRYSYNMDDDADDALVFSSGCGACGQCWTKHDFVIANLSAFDPSQAANRRNEYGLTKYEQALVGPRLRSLMCVPIFDPSRFNKNRPKIDNPVIGVLSIDSDEEILADFDKTEIQQHAAEIAGMVADQLIGQTSSM